MAAKTFKCVICDTEVSKPQSYAYNGGRACRTHPEVQAAHEAAEQAKSANIQQHKDQPSHRRGYSHSFDNPANFRDPHSHCWCCGKDSVYAHVFAQRALINMSKSKLSGEEVNPFDANSPHHVALRKEFGGKVITKQFPATMFKEWQLKQLFAKDHDKVMVAQMSGIAVICIDCAKEYGIDWNYNMPKDLSGEGFRTMMALGALIEPEVDMMASEELAADASKKAMAR